MHQKNRKLILSLLTALAIGIFSPGCSVSPDAGMSGHPDGAVSAEAVSGEDRGNPWHSDGSSARWSNPWRNDLSRKTWEGRNPWTDGQIDERS